MQIFGKIDFMFLDNVKLEKMVSGYLFLYLLTMMNKANVVKATRKDLINKTNLSSDRISIGLKELKSKDLLRKQSRSEYFLNPDFIHYGDQESYFVKKAKYKTLPCGE